MDSASLTFELFAICIKVYKLLLEAEGMPKQGRYLHIRLQIERDKLVDWGVLSNLSEDENTLNSGIQLNQHKVNGALHEIRLVLLDLTKLCVWPGHDQTGKFLTNRGIGDSHKAASLKINASLQKKAISFAETTRMFPLQVRWATFDRKKYELLLAKLTALNQNMVYFFETRQQGNHSQMQENDFVGILQANNTIDDLLNMMAALNATSLYMHISAREERLLRLVRSKAFQIAINKTENSLDEGKIRDLLGDPPTHHNRVLLDHGRYIGGEEDDVADYEPARTWGTYNSVPVWVEWRYYEPVGRQKHSPPHIEDRIAKLATLLRDEQQPEEFSIPNCLGYIHEAVRSRFGLVFQGAGNFPPPRLLDMIASSSRPRPSLTTRIQIARSVASSIWYLHATNWLHKGLRSENIVFPLKPPAHPYLTGFEYSRPANPTDVFERPPGNRYHDLYRHPLTQFQFPREGRDGFNKLYDIYSLGVVLYEIGMWKPVHAILGIDITAAAGGIGFEEIEDAQKRLLSEECLMSLAADVGDAYMATVASCLSGDFGFDSFDGQSDQGNYDARLQLEFGERVIRKLDSIMV